eukprot:TRINITY_DN3149_c0_g1_i3.p1 TRINITY_DN3149_c0_g1~~TRINITY_DN3149_c0_g1_i3.p1  ORF type:complete len:309 (-),score=47.39 TRINITY_DN3149_c0_g1_i3:522-1448(-)
MSEFSSRQLSNTAWAFATLAVDDESLMSALADQARTRIEDFAARDIANTAWAFATLGISDAPLFDAICQVALSTVSAMNAQELANFAWAVATLQIDKELLKDEIAKAALDRLESLADIAASDSEKGKHPVAAFGIVHSLAILSRYDSSISLAAEKVCRNWADRLDSPQGSRGKPSLQDSSAVQEDAVQACLAGGDEPSVLLERSHICVLWKPPGWTVSIDHSVGDESEQKSSLVQEDLSSSGGTKALQDWVVQHLSSKSSVALDKSAGHGLLHRLDRDTSGLILCAKSYLGYYLATLRFQACFSKRRN